MNILPKKSWHVLSKKNIDRVRKDEAEAKAQEEEKQRRAEIAEREARLELMRSRVRQREGYDDDEEKEELQAVEQPDKETQPSNKHINFFQDMKKGVGVQSTNEEHDAEQKADQEKLEKRIGLLNYLVDKDKSEDPWYVKHKSASEESAKSRRRKERMDPLNDMKHFVEAKKKCTETLARPTLLPSPSYHKSLSSSSTEHGQSVERTEHIQHKEKSKKHKRHKSKSKSKDREKEKAHLEEMRRKRRQREEAERMRTEAMLRQHYGDGEGKESATSGPQMVEEMPGRYNSQFNPHLARH